MYGGYITNYSFKYWFFNSEAHLYSSISLLCNALKLSSRTSIMICLIYGRNRCFAINVSQLSIFCEKRVNFLESRIGLGT